MHTVFCLENLKGRDHLEDLHIDGRIIIDWIGLDPWETGWEGVEWMHLAQDRDQWWVLVNMVMNLWVP
jgi:hypothetical protein